GSRATRYALKQRVLRSSLPALGGREVRRVEQRSVGESCADRGATSDPGPQLCDDGSRRWPGWYLFQLLQREVEDVPRPLQDPRLRQAVAELADRAVDHRQCQREVEPSVLTGPE